MNPPETAPKDGDVFLADLGDFYISICRWNPVSNKWVSVIPQTGLVDGVWNDYYFETEFVDEKDLRGWTPIPKL